MDRFDELRRRQLDASLVPLKTVLSAPPPDKGWLRVIRQALGMSLRQVAARAGVSKTTAASVEKNEAKGTVQLDSLRRIADAMDCEVVYAIVPRGSLEATLQLRAREAAERMVGRVADSMELEAQGTSRSEREELVRELTARYRANPSELWDV